MNTRRRPPAPVPARNGAGDWPPPVPGGLRLVEPWPPPIGSVVYLATYRMWGRVLPYTTAGLAPGHSVTCKDIHGQVCRGAWPGETYR